MKYFSRAIEFLKRWSLLLISIPFLTFVYSQSIGQFEATVFIKSPQMASQVISEGDFIRVGWKNEPFSFEVDHKESDGLVSAQGKKILFDSIVFVRKDEEVHVYSNQWSRMTGSVSSLKAMAADGEIIKITLRGPPEFVTTVKWKTEAGFIADNGKMVRYEDVGYIIKKMPLVKSFTKNLVRDVLIVPAFLIWLFVDFLSIFGLH